MTGGEPPFIATYLSKFYTIPVKCVVGWSEPDYDYYGLLYISAVILSYAVCSVGANANVLGFAFMTEAQLAEKTAYYGQEYMDIISGYFSHGYMLPFLAITAFAGGARWAACWGKLS